MQDLCGIRIVLYYRDDIDIVVSLIQKKFYCLEIVRDQSDVEEFKPERLNIVVKFPAGLNSITDDCFFENYYIDKTFEIQIRTVFSEGWHEIEHDMRYKCSDSWNDYEEHSRMLNGVWATLSTCDWAMLQLFNDLAYSNYKNKQWKELIRNKYRLRMQDGEVDSDIINTLMNNMELAKALYRYDRARLIGILNESRITIPITANNIVRIINTDSNICKELTESTSEIIIEALSKME